MGLELDFLLKGRDEFSGVFDKATGRVNAFLDKFPNLTRNLVAGASAAYALSTAFSYVSEKTGELIKLAEQKEQADLRMAQAMKTNLLYTNESYKGMQEFAEQMKRTYAVEDETIESMVSRLAPFGMSMTEIKKAIPVILDFAKAKDIDNTSAADFLGKAYVGHVQMLQRMGIVLDSTRVKTEGLDYILGEFNKRFGGAAQADIDSYTRKVQQLGLAWDDIKKKAGEKIVFVIKPIVEWVDSGLNNSSSDWADSKQFGDWVSRNIDRKTQQFYNWLGKHGFWNAGPKRKDGLNSLGFPDADVSTDDMSDDAALAKEQSRVDESANLNKQAQAAKDHASTMVGIDKMEKDLELANLDGWEKQKADLEKKFDEEEKSLREQGTKDLTEFEKRKTAVIEEEHKKWLKSLKDTAAAELDTWRDETKSEGDEREKALEEAAKKYDEIAEKYKAAKLSMKDVDEQFLKVVDQINKKFEEAGWQKAVADMNKITAKRVANDAAIDKTLSGVNPTDFGFGPAGDMSRELIDSRQREQETLTLASTEMQKVQIREKFEAEQAAIVAKYNKQILDDTLKTESEIVASIYKDTGVMLSAYEQQEEEIINKKAKAERDYLEKQKNRDDLTVEDQRKVADALAAIEDQRIAKLKELHDAYDGVADAAKNAGMAQQGADSTTGGSKSGGGSSAAESQTPGMGDQWGDTGWGNTNFSGGGDELPAGMSLLDKGMDVYYNTPGSTLDQNTGRVYDENGKIIYDPSSKSSPGSNTGWGNTNFSGGLGGGSVSSGGTPVVTGGTPVTGPQAIRNTGAGNVTENSSVTNENGVFNTFNFPNALVLTQSAGAELVKALDPIMQQLKAKGKI